MNETRTTPSENVLLQEYREAMESQRSNTIIVYSWMGSIFLVSSTGLYYGSTLIETEKFIPTMILAFAIVFVWWGLNESFIFYIKQRVKRIHEIEGILNIKLMSDAGKEIEALGWKAKFLEARNYIRFFIVIYILVWILMLILHF